MHSSALSFEPAGTHPETYEIDVGTAGSTMLVFQPIFPALACCDARSRVLLRGGMHNPRAPTFEFVRDAFAPVVARTGFNARMTLERPGFYPKGDGIVHVTIEPRSTAKELMLTERELNVLHAKLGLRPKACVTEHARALGPPNVLHLKAEAGRLIQRFIPMTAEAEELAPDRLVWSSVGCRQVVAAFDAGAAARRSAAQSRAACGTDWRESASNWCDRSRGHGAVP